MKFGMALVAVAFLSVSLTGNLLVRAAGGKEMITGAGASFPAPLYAKWVMMYNGENPQVEINYQSIGSGGGIKQLTARTVDFGASDAPMTDDELKATPGPVVHIPTVMGAVALTYNLGDLPGAIKLTPGVLSDIYLAKIKKWNDPRIQLLNKGINLPSKDIAVVYRADSSGTTAIFTDYLSKVSPDWNKTVGAGKTVKWPGGLGGKGNEGVTSQVKNTPGAIGYVELVYAEQQKLPMVLLRNKAGQFVKPSIESVSAAAAGVKNMPDDYRVSITNADGKDAYPISSFTYLLVYKTMDKTKGTTIVNFLNWAMAKGQTVAPSLSYAPLPRPMLAKVKGTIKSLEIK